MKKNEIEVKECEIVKDTQVKESIESIGTQVNNFLGNIGSLFDKGQNYMSLYADCVKMKEQTKQIQAWSQVEIARTVAKYKLCKEFLDRTFGERDKALSKHYDLLDKAVASNDRELILAALSGISSTVTKSPLDDFEKFVELYNYNSRPLLDF